MAQVKNPAGIMVETDGIEDERRLARSVRALMLDAWPLGAGECAAVDRRRIDGDPELAAFLAVVAGANGWSEERLRVARARVGPVPRRDPGEMGPGPLTERNILRVLPLWRQWGRLLLEAGRAKVAGAAGAPADIGGTGGPASGPDPAPDDQAGCGPKGR